MHDSVWLRLAIHRKCVACAGCMCVPHVAPGYVGAERQRVRGVDQVSSILYTECCLTVAHRDEHVVLATSRNPVTGSGQLDVTATPRWIRLAQERGLDDDAESISDQVIVGQRHPRCARDGLCADSNGSNPESHTDGFSHMAAHFVVANQCRDRRCFRKSVLLDGGWNRQHHCGKNDDSRNSPADETVVAHDVVPGPCNADVTRASATGGIVALHLSTRCAEIDCTRKSALELIRGDRYALGSQDENSDSTDQGVSGSTAGLEPESFDYRAVTARAIHAAVHHDDVLRVSSSAAAREPGGGPESRGDIAAAGCGPS